MELSPEDALRINVLIANAEAVRIDENSMTVYGLQGEQEMKFPLNPTCRSDKYLQLVREMLSSAVLDSPGGYPVYLRRWTRMGQIDTDQLDLLLKIGEPEAVMAVVCAPGLDDELARRAWWCAPYSEHARRMLTNPTIVAGEMGRVLAEHLVEHLPFETEPRDMLATVRLVLQPGLIDDEQRERLWDSGKTKKAYRIGFLETLPRDLPEAQSSREDIAEHVSALESLAEQGNAYAEQLRWLLGAEGQAFLTVAGDVLARLPDQDVAAALFNALGRHFAAFRRGEAQRELAAIAARVDEMVAQPDEALAALLAAAPQLEQELRHILTLAQVSETLLDPIFGQTDAVGTVMQERIEPLTTPLGALLAELRGLDPQQAGAVRRRRGRRRQ